MNQTMALPATPPSLEQSVPLIQSRTDFIAFLRAFQNDLRKNPGGWSNNDLPSFLEAMAAWVEDMEGYYHQRGETPPEQPLWQTVGQILMAARVYE